jgi:hypothetical protein
MASVKNDTEAAFSTMASAPPLAAFANLVAGSDGSPAARRALDDAVLLLHGRAGRIDVISGHAVEPIGAPPDHSEQGRAGTG